MAFNVANFKSQLSSYGYLMTNKFQLLVTPPLTLQGQGALNTLTTGAQVQSSSINDLANQMQFHVDAVNAPSVSLALTDINRYGVGPSQKYPTNANFNTLTLTFFSDGYGELWQFWYQWVQSIFGFSGVDSGQQGSALINSAGSYTLDYKDNYSSYLSLFIYDNYGNKVQQIDYTEAYPFAINDVQFNWGESNQLLKITVEMSFTDYMIVGTSQYAGTGTSPTTNIAPAGLQNLNTNLVV